MLPIRLPDDHHQGLLSLGRKQVTEKCITATVSLYYSLYQHLFFCTTAYTGYFINAYPSIFFTVLLPMLVTTTYPSYCITVLQASLANV